MVRTILAGMAKQEAAPVLDTYDLSEPQDVLSELNKSKGENGPFWKGIKEAKWSIRRDALKELQVGRLGELCADS